jgi:hypothetical protein
MTIKSKGQRGDSITRAATVVMAVAAVAMAVVAGLQWKTLEKTDETLRADQRPWVTYSDVRILGPLTFNEAGARVTLEFRLKNTGHSPAQRVGIWTTMFPQTSSRTPDLELKKYCGRVRNRPPDPVGYGYALFPGDTLPPQAISISIDRAEIDRALPGMFGRFISPFICGCIDYDFQPSEGRHQTRFAFRLERVDESPPNPGAHVAIEPGLRSIPASQLVLTVWLAGSQAD